MKTLKFTTTQKIEKEIEVNFPCYRKKYGMFYRATSEKEIVRVIPGQSEITKSSGLSFMFDENSEEISANEFEEKLNAVKTELGI